MSAKRIVAIIAIYLVACMGWALLGTTTATRSDQYANRLGRAAQDLWGTPLVHQAPRVSVTVPGSDRQRPIMPVKNDILVQVELDYRQKGLIWYPTYQVHFLGASTRTIPTAFSTIRPPSTPISSATPSPVGTPRTKPG
ncbi:MAG: hypothetical protein ACYTGH_14545 [Planctomycetota bacterium]